MAECSELKEYIAGIQNSLQCSICLELLRNPVVTKCGHQFCDACIMNCIKRRASIPCPLCKEPVSKRSLQHRERLNSLTNSIRDLVCAYEEDTGATYSVPSGPRLVKDITRVPDVSVRLVRLPPERIAMASLENTESSDVENVASPPAMATKSTRKVDDKKVEVREKSKGDNAFAKDDTSVFSDEHSIGEVGLPATKETAPNIFSQDELCPKIRKKRSRKSSIIKVKNWLSRLPPVIGPEEENVPVLDDSQSKADSQSSDHTVLLDEDMEHEAIDISSLNATIAPGSSRSLSASSGTSPNPRHFFKYHWHEKTKVNVVSPNTKIDDPYAFPASAEKNQPIQGIRRCEMKIAPVQKSHGVDRNKNESPSNAVQSAIVDYDFKEDRKNSSAVFECFGGPEEVSEVGVKATRTYAQTTRRVRLRGRKLKRVSESEKESEFGVDEITKSIVEDKLDKVADGTMDNGDSEFTARRVRLRYSELTTRRVRLRGRKLKRVSESEKESEYGVDKITKSIVEDKSDKVADGTMDNGDSEFTAKRLKRTDSELSTCRKMRGELEDADSFELDVVTTSQQVREENQRRDELSCAARKIVKEILAKSNVEAPQKREDRCNSTGINEDANVLVADNESDSDTDEIILEIHVKNAEDETEVVERIFVSPAPGQKAERETCQISVDQSQPECVEVLEPVSILVGDSEPGQVSPEKTEQEAKIGEAENFTVDKADEQALSTSPVLGASVKSRVSYAALETKKTDMKFERNNSPKLGIATSGGNDKSDSRTESPAEAMQVDEIDNLLPSNEVLELRCRESDSSGDELPDLASLRTKSNVNTKKSDVHTSRPDCKNNAVKQSGSGDRTESISLSVSEIKFEKPIRASTEESFSTISSIYAPSERLNDEFSTGKCLANQMIMSSLKCKANVQHSDYSKLSDSENLTLLSEFPTTQVRENLQKELHDLSRLIKEKEEQLMQLDSTRTQVESTVALDSDSDCDLFVSQDATAYAAQPGETEVRSRSNSPASPTPPVVRSSNPPTPPSAQKIDLSGQDCESIIAATPAKKSPRILAAELARTFSSIKAATSLVQEELEEELDCVEHPAPKRTWKRIRTRSDSDSEAEVVPNSIEDKTPRRKGTIDVFLTKKRLLDEEQKNERDSATFSSPSQKEGSSSLLKTPGNRAASSRRKGSEMICEWNARENLRAKDDNSLIAKGISLVATGGAPILPSSSRSRSLASAATRTVKKEDFEESISLLSKSVPKDDAIELMSDSCDFMAAMRSPSPVEPITPAVVPESEEVNSSKLSTQVEHSAKQGWKNYTGSSNSKETNLEESEQSELPETNKQSMSKVIPAPSSAILDRSEGLQVASPLAGNILVLSPYQGEVLRARREQCRGLVVSGLDSRSREYVLAFTKKFDFAFSPTFGDETSHVVVQTMNDDDLVCERTLKYFLGIAGRCWVLSKQWLIDSVEQDFLEPEDTYEIRGDTVNGAEHLGPWRARNARSQLLANFTICCHGTFSNLGRTDIVHLIELCGGKAIVDENEFLASGPTKWRRLILAEPHEDLRSSYFHSLKEKFGMPVVSREWLLDSVAKYQVQKLKEYSLCSTG